MAAALHRADSQSTPYQTNHTAGAASSPRLTAATAATAAASPFGRSSGSSTAPTAVGAAVGSSGMLDRLRRVGSSSGSSVGSSSSNGPAGAAAAGAQQQQQQAAGQHSRLSKVTGWCGDGWWPLEGAGKACCHTLVNHLCCVRCYILSPPYALCTVLLCPNPFLRCTTSSLHTQQ